MIRSGRFNRLGRVPLAIQIELKYVVVDDVVVDVVVVVVVVV